MEVMGSPSILFVHKNFPAQFGSLGTQLRETGWQVTFLTAKKNAASGTCRIAHFDEPRKARAGNHPYVEDLEGTVLLAEEVSKGLFKLNREGYRPDIIMAHSGLGAAFVAKDLWPSACYIPYCEWWQRFPQASTHFLTGKTPGDDVRLRQRFRNVPKLLDFECCDRALCPTQFQTDQFPVRLRTLITVIHDGIDTVSHAPAPERPLTIGNYVVADMPEIVTYATRGMEPHRGFPQFIRALHILQQRRPKLHALIAGSDRVAYGNPLPEGDSWKKRMLAECALDMSRTHFTGRLPREDYLKVLQVSNAHVYLTVPFVLSWSMLEAMSTGCALVGSNTEPVREFIRHGENGLLADFHSPEGIADAIEWLLENRAEAARLGAQARALIQAEYDLDRVFQRKLRWFHGAIGVR